LLLHRALALPRLRNGRDELGATAALDNPLGGLAVLVELPILSWVLIWRIEDWSLEKLIVHVTGKLPLNITLHEAHRVFVAARRYC
jgi:hypothetical protein